MGCDWRTLYIALKGRIWTVQLRPTDLADLVRRTARECGPAAQERLILDVPRIQVQADPERLVQILANLLTNALKYSPQDKPVRVRAHSWPARGVAWLEVHEP